MENNNSLTVYQQAEIIKKIERLGGKFDPNSALSIEDQLFICESLVQESLNDFQEINNENLNVNASVKWNDNDACKRGIGTKETLSKHDAIKALRIFTYKTPPIEIEEVLQAIFVDNPSKDGHWLFVAQNWNPRAINRVIERMDRLHTSGRKTIINPAAYFTSLIKFRKKRKSL